MNEPGNHHSQQTDTRTENQTPHVLTYRWVLNNENTWTQGWEHHTPGPVRGGEQGEGEHQDKYLMYAGLKTTIAHVYLCNKPVRSAHVFKNLK